MPVKLNSSGGGSVTLDVPSTASTFTATIPAQTGTLITTAGSAVVTPTMLSQPMTLMAAQASTSGTAIDFTGIPSWAKRITVMFMGVSTNGTSNYQIQVGTSGTIATSGYVGAVTNQAGTTAANSTGFQVANTQTAADLMWGSAVLLKTGGNATQVAYTSILANSNAANLRYGAGAVTPANVIDTVRITTVNGTDTFDAGSINILYEG